MSKNKRKAVVLVSGGLDSATVMALALDQGYDIFALAFDYGQRHRAELNASKQLASSMGVQTHKILNIDLSQFGGSALTDSGIDVPTSDNGELAKGIPVTYVPARNTVFLSLALAWAEVLEAHDIFIGVNSVDYSGYPDCRAEFIQAFEATANLATKVGVEGQKISIHTPLIDLTKAQIIGKGVTLGVDYSQTVSCYQANEVGEACGKCDSCHIRKAGFLEAGVPDPTRYFA